MRYVFNARLWAFPFLLRTWVGFCERRKFVENKQATCFWWTYLCVCPPHWLRFVSGAASISCKLCCWRRFPFASVLLCCCYWFALFVVVIRIFPIFLLLFVLVGSPCNWLVVVRLLRCFVVVAFSVVLFLCLFIFVNAFFSFTR